MRNIFYFLFCNKKLKFLTNQNSRITTKFLSSLIKIIKHFNQEKKLKPQQIYISIIKKLNLFIMYLFLY